MTREEYTDWMADCVSWFDDECDCNACIKGVWLLQQLTERDRALADAENVIHDLRAEVEAIRKQTRWIPVTERLPLGQEDVLCYEGGIVTTRTFMSRCWRMLDGPAFVDTSLDRVANVTHWMPLPTPPAPEEEPRP